MSEFSMGLSLLADATEKVAVANQVGLGVGGKLLMLLLMCVLPYVFGAIISRALRVKEFSNRIGTVILAFTFGLAPFVYQIATTRDVGSWHEAMRWGIDLKGGTNLIYQVETAQAKDDGKNIPEAMDRMIAVIKERLDPSGTEEISIRRVGDNRIEIIIPGADPGVLQQKKNDIVKLGSLEFGIVANDRDNKSLINKARLNSEKTDPVTEGTRVIAVWRDVKPGEDPPSSSSANVGLRTLTTRKHKVKKGDETKEIPVVQALILKERDEDLVSGKYLTRASTGLAESGSTAVNFSFNTEGGSRFFRLTNKNRPSADGHKKQLAILLDNQVHSAPNINSTIRSSGQITGSFSKDELDSLVKVLNAGALELPIVREPIGEFSISATLGGEVAKKGIWAISFSAIAVFVFMLVYYRFSGLVANVSLILNMVLIVGSMAICNATFTLPGLAGMVLTIGMAVDTNVLIYERMREEMTRGSSLKMTIFNGFDKALSAIVDSNITTLIAAVVLYMIGTDQIRGFAVSLFIGISMSMFSALYFGHLMFDIAERKRWIRDRLSMVKLIGVTNIDFIGKLKIALTFSISFIALGVVLVFARGEESLDIDFRGGSMVTFKFEHPQQIDDVRQKLIANFASDITVERLALPEEDASIESGVQFRLRTTEQDVNTIRLKISNTFPSDDAKYVLHRTTVIFTPPTTAVSESKPAIELEPAKPSETTKSESPVTEKSSAADPKCDDAQPAADAEGKSEKQDEAAKKDESDTPSKTAEEKPGNSTEEKPAAKPDDTKPDDTKPADVKPAKSDKPAASTAEIPVDELDVFAGGQMTNLVFSNGITTATASDYLMDALKDINPKEYTDAAALLRITGIPDADTAQEEGKVATFLKMTVEANKVISEEHLSKALASMQETLATTPLFEEVNNFASSVAESMRYMAIVALLVSGLATVLYLWFRFTKADFGIAAVIAVFHDVLFVLACLPFAYYLGIDDFKLNLSIIAAFLTIIGYSLNDTIVIFDRVREIRGRNPSLTTQMVNDSVNQTLSRTILTALTVFITVAILFFFGGEGIHGFAFCMLVGTLVGTYSTVFIASPFLLWMWNREQKKAEANRIANGL